MIKKKVVVLSLGGSLIIPEKINYVYLERFKKTVQKMFKTHKFAVVCGGGAIARAYINALTKEHRTKEELVKAGVRATRMNAMFMMQFFGNSANSTLPKDMEDVENELRKNNIVFCGALRVIKNSTSDGTAARLAHYLKSDFINLTDVPGLYTDNPKTNRNAKLIRKIRWKDFESLANKIKFENGQHFVLDQEAARLIRKSRIKTYIIGTNVENLENALKGKIFVGTKIEG